MHTAPSHLHARHVHEVRHDHAGPAPAHARGRSSLDRVALMATLHCLAGCAIGEVAGLAIGTALGWGNLETVALALVLAFASGYALTMVPLLRSGRGFREAARIAIVADTASIAVMEIVDNLLMLAIPGAMDAPLDSPLFWASLAVALALAGAVAYPLNRWLISRGRGHAVVHAEH